jgi:hypothetical protein
MESVLRRPRAGNHIRRRTALAGAQRGADEGMVAIVPGRFDEHPAEMRVAGFGDATLRAFRPARVLRGDEADESHRRGGGGKATRVAQLRRDREGGEVVDAAEAPEPRDPWTQRLKIEQRTEIRFDVTEAGNHFIDRAQIGPMCLIEGGQRPRLRAEPDVVALRPGLLGRREPTAMAEEELRKAMPCAK